MNDSHSPMEQRCYYCQELVQTEAILCPHCRSFIDPMDAPIALEKQRKMPELLQVTCLRDHFKASDHYGLAVGKGQENLLRTINLCLAVLRNREVLEELRKTHGLPD